MSVKNLAKMKSQSKFSFQSLEELMESFAISSNHQKPRRTNTVEVITGFAEEVGEIIDRDFHTRNPRKSIAEIEETDFSRSTTKQLAPPTIPVTVLPAHHEQQDMNGNDDKQVHYRTSSQPHVLWLPESRMKIAENLPDRIPRLYDERLSDALANPLLQRSRKKLNI